MTLKYFSKLKVWKNSKGSCVFDGTLAFSYEWYCIAVVLPSGKIILNNCRYSSTTGKHISDIRHHFGYEVEIFYVNAPRGLTRTEETAASLKSEIKSIKEKLKNPRLRGKERLSARLLEIEKELKLNTEIAKFLKKRNEEKAA